MKIQLNTKEKQIVDLLLNASSSLLLKTPIRFAGGWVRDKLLGIESNDIDVVLEDKMGYDFACQLKDYIIHVLQQPQILNHSGNIAVIKSNPDKSKHLETATMGIFGHELDFVNLRSETYMQGNRIPEMVEIIFILEFWNSFTRCKSKRFDD